MKLKTWLKYLVYTLLVIAGIRLKSNMEVAMQNSYTATYKINYLITVIVLLATMLIGVIIGFEQFYSEANKEGKWRVNVPKLVLLGIPSLYGSLIYLLAFINNKTVYNIFVNPVYNLFCKNTSFITVYQMLLGYFIITSFYKAAKKPEEAVEGNMEAVEENTEVADDNTASSEGMDSEAAKEENVQSELKQENEESIVKNYTDQEKSEDSKETLE